MQYSIDEKISITFQASKYFLRIRSCDDKNPVVLFLHGGCGSPDRAHVMKYQSPLAKKFTLVCWDQRGAGLAYDKQEAKNLTLTKEIYVEDAHNVTTYLKQRFKKDKIIIVGHSFGSVLGVWLTQKYPDDIYAYVGVGQCVDYIRNEELSYLWTLEKAKMINDKKSLRILNNIGFPKNGKFAIDHQKCLMKQRSILHKLGGAKYSNKKSYWQELLFDEAPVILKEYGISGAVKYIKGLSYSPNQPLGQTNPDFLNTAKELSVPVFLLLGKHDKNCVVELAEEWYMQLNAPIKKLVYFENSAHSPQWEESEKWNKIFTELFTDNTVKLVRATLSDANLLWQMQKEAFSSLLERYQDYDTNPGAESLDRILDKLKQPCSYFYFIKRGNDTIGAIRIKDTKISSEKKGISPIFVLPKYRRQGVAKAAILQAEKIHGATGWEIDTILQEPNLCRFYEKLGYVKSNRQKVISSNMTLVFYTK